MRSLRFAASFVLLAAGPAWAQATPEPGAGTATPAVAAPPAPAALSDSAAPAAEGLPETTPADSFTAADASSNTFVAEDGPKLELYGFADFSYLHVFGSKRNVNKQYVAPHPRF